MRAPLHLARRGFLYATGSLVPLVALYALFDAADHGIGSLLATVSRLASIAAQVAPVAACIGAIAAAAVAASRAELRTLAALGVRPTRVGLWIGVGALPIALAGGLGRADLAPRLARAFADGRPEPGALGWVGSDEPRWVLAGGDLVRCANVTCDVVWSASAMGISRRSARRGERAALQARAPASVMQLTPAELMDLSRVRRSAGLSASALDVELWLRVSLAALALLLPCAAAAIVTSRPSRARVTAYGAAAAVAVLGLIVGALAQGATAGAWPAWLPMLPACLLPMALAAWAQARSH